MRHITGIAVALGSLIVAAGAEETPRDAQQTRAPAQASVNSEGPDKKTSTQMVRASSMIGMNIQNPEGKSVGEVHDLVVDAENGKIRYAAVSYGGFLGLGDKLFAVPFAAFQCRPAAEDSDQRVLILDVTQQQLEGARGFDEDRWPDFADPQFTDDIDRRYRDQVRFRLRVPNVDVRVNGAGVDVDLKDSDSRK